ncbi:peptidoglycan DD-metalloendopeptidase family protein [Rheinheimera sp. MMS21-TC3]|uniref:peptidoglycan DD-metalloendopeptidase family protein n=1 Tax=Rheinheimera sp. MMS21-TC3 TaxID=3072790 RepID=UPI0028C47A37|nr:peptidoglycan DD-metalloendopeptidase family protein [Rheinheimera sp. MMS21-TC3]WNO61950.1 peptidoglycan DD-metalloendopeptidase family protein [Rheinheimera sp. MMS21-TC3]
MTTLELRKNFYNERNKGSLQVQQYTVRKGDTLYAIAFRAGLDVRKLAGLNNISSPYIIYPGQIIKLKLPPNQSRPVSTAAAKTSAAKKPSSQIKSNSSVKSPKPVAPKKQTEYVQTTTNNKVTKPPIKLPNTALVQWQWPVKGKIVSGFSYQEQGNKGIDITGVEGSRVNAAASGQVVYAGNALRGYGNLIIIKHNDDYLSAYAHNRKLLVQERQMVSAGQQIAEMGKTDATDVRLHFEIRYRGGSVDPMKYLPRR